MLHITNGDSAAGTLKQSGVPGAFSIWSDVLWEGPVPGGLESEAFRETRARFTAAAGYETYETALERMRRWDAALESYPDYGEVVLWFEHDLFDQLILIRLLDWFGRRDLGRTRLALISISEYPGVARFIGLGQLTPPQMASLLGTRLEVTARQMELAGAAWRAFTSPDPTAIEALLAGDAVALPYLEDALRRFLEEYPSVTNGLARSEQQALRVAADRGPAPWRDLFRATYAMEERVFMGDSSFWGLLCGLKPALLTGDEVTSITHLGRRVLEGRDDWIRLRGIDRWLGGVHLKGAESPCRWDAGAGRLVRWGAAHHVRP